MRNDFPFMLRFVSYVAVCVICHSLPATNQQFTDEQTNQPDVPVHHSFQLQRKVIVVIGVVDGVDMSCDGSGID